MKHRIPQTNHQEPKHEDITLLAYLIWEREGRPDGRAPEYWTEAEMQLQATMLAEQTRTAKTENKQRFPNRLASTEEIVRV